MQETNIFRINQKGIEHNNAERLHNQITGTQILEFSFFDPFGFKSPQNWIIDPRRQLVTKSSHKILLPE